MPVIGIPDSLININDGTDIYKGATGQVLTDQIKQSNNKPYNIPASASVSFSMRPANSSAAKIVNSSAAVINPTDGAVSYSWTDSDVDTSGEFFGWWTIEVSGVYVDTDEFPILIRKHSPGVKGDIGRIYRLSMSYLPSTWIALQNLNTYGDAVLQDKIEYVKYAILEEECTVAQEDDLDIRVANYIAKNVVVQIIPAGIDYWLDQRVGVTIETGAAAQENVRYEDRAQSLMDLYDRLLKEIAREKADIEDILDNKPVRDSNSVPMYAEGQDDGFVTPSPVLNFRDYNFPKPPFEFPRRFR